MTTETATEQARTFRSALVGLCRVCGLYTEPKEGLCPGDCYTSEFSMRSARQVLRRVLICSSCEHAFRPNLDAQEHDCNDYYV